MKLTAEQEQTRAEVAAAFVGHGLWFVETEIDEVGDIDSLTFLRDDGRTILLTAHGLHTDGWINLTVVEL